MVFLINIIRILVMKLRSAHSNEPSQYRFVKKHTLLLLENLNVVIIKLINLMSQESGPCYSCFGASGNKLYVK